MALSDDEEATMSKLEYLELSLLQGALMKFSWGVSYLLASLDIFKSSNDDGIAITKINTIIKFLLVWKKGLAMSVPKNTDLTDPANYCLHFAPRPTNN